MRILGLTVAALAVLLSPAAMAFQFDSDCHALKLKTASGVPGGKLRQYEFNGTCNIIRSMSSGPEVLRTIPAEASATWDAQKKELRETFRVLAPFSGKVMNEVWKVQPQPVTSTFACNDDPLVTNASCGVLNHDNQSGYVPFSNPAKLQSRPLLKGKTTLAEASKLSAQAAPPMTGVALPWKAKAAVASAVAFEAEGLFDHRKAQVNGGTLHVQPMQDFGTGWGNNAQLFWSGGAPGAVLDLTFKVQVAGKYRVELFMTRAPDYGNLVLQVEGNMASASFSGYSAAVVPSNAIEVGTFQLAAGERRISLKIISKDAKSSGFLVGVDQLRLIPVVTSR